MDYQALKAALDQHRAVLGASGELGTATFTLETRREHFPAVLDLLRQVLREPALADSELDILRQEALAELEQSKTDPQGLAPTYVRRALSPYPAHDVRYVPTIEESIARVSRVTSDAVRRLHGYLRPDAGELAVVGDFDSELVVRWADEVLGGFEPAAHYRRIEYRAFDDIPPGRTTIRTPDKANALYFAGLVFPMRDDHPDYPALVMANEVLGGSPNARLFVRIRQQQGISYGVYSGFSARALDPRAGLTIFGISNPENAEKMAASIREVLDQLLADEIPQPELDEVRGGYLQQEEVQRADDRRLCALLNDAAFAGRTLEFNARIESRIESLTPQDVSAAVRKYFDPNKLVIALAGDFPEEEAGAP